MTTETVTKQTFCYDERHAVPCPLPCLACEADGCDYGQAPTSTATHTPTPWRTVRIDSTGLNGITSDAVEPSIIATAHDYVADDYSAEAEANAVFIVRAVNSHDGLVEALRNILADCETAENKCDHGGVSFADYDFAVVHAIEYARAALKLAEVEEGR